MSWITSIGVLNYGPGERRVVLHVDQGIADFYRAMLPKWLPANAQYYPAHISVVRHETSPNMSAWKKHEGERIAFEYKPEVVGDETYYWLDVWCSRLCEIRTELGLAPYPWWRNRFHITIANRKAFRTEAELLAVAERKARLQARAAEEAKKPPSPEGYPGQDYTQEEEDEFGWGDRFS